MAEEKVTKTKVILSFQPFPILAQGGGARILRRLVEGRQDEVIFFSFVDKITKSKSTYLETAYVVFPSQKWWMRSYLRNISDFFRNTLLYRFHARRIKAKVSKLQFDVLHILDHGKYANILTEWAQSKKIPIWVSFHDHFKTTDSLNNATKALWVAACKRMVISKEMGEHYCELFGLKKYDIVTDGLKDFEISPAKTTVDLPKLTIYFAGLLHFEYYQLFKTFCKALNVLSKQEGIRISLILRGTQKLDFLDNASIDIDYRGFTTDQDFLKEEMDEADILYLPIKYDNEYFYKYSFSTKMVGYLGSPGHIFYHGPKEAAAARFLEKHECGVICDTLEPMLIVEKLKEVICDYTYSSAAKKVAYAKFKLKDMQKLFWS